MCKGITRQFMDHPENPDYLETQILTYLGNKRALLNAIGEELETIKNERGGH